MDTTKNRKNIARAAKAGTSRHRGVNASGDFQASPPKIARLVVTSQKPAHWRYQNTSLQSKKPPSMARKNCHGFVKASRRAPSSSKTNPTQYTRTILHQQMRNRVVNFLTAG